MESAPDQLKQFALDSHPAKHEILVLDVAAFHEAWKDDLPLPGFASSNKQGEPRPSRVCYLDPPQLDHILSSPLSPQLYQFNHGVEEIIVRFLREREEEVRARLARLLGR